MDPSEAHGTLAREVDTLLGMQGIPRQTDLAEPLRPFSLSWRIHENFGRVSCECCRSNHRGRRVSASSDHPSGASWIVSAFDIELGMTWNCEPLTCEESDTPVAWTLAVKFVPKPGIVCFVNRTPVICLDTAGAKIRAGKAQLGNLPDKDYTWKESHVPPCVSTPCLEFRCSGTIRPPVDKQFSSAFGSNKIEIKFLLSPVTKPSLILEVVRGLHTSLKMVPREEKQVETYRKLHRRPVNEEDEDSYVVKSQNQGFSVGKRVLAERSPVFNKCFKHSGTRENVKNRYEIVGFAAEVVEQFLLFCECGVVPEIKQHCLELAKLAHQYQVKALLDLCEFYLVRKAVKFEGLIADPEAFLEFLEVCSVAALLDLDLLLICLHFVIQDQESRWIAGLQRELWKDFIVRTPDFHKKKYLAISKTLDTRDSGEIESLSSGSIPA